MISYGEGLFIRRALIIRK